MNFNKITEEDSLHQNLDLLDTIDLLHGINNEDQKVAKAVQLIIPDIEKFINSRHRNLFLAKVVDEHNKLNLKTSKLKGLPKRDSKDLRVYNLPQRNKIFIDLISIYLLS